jgi:hypothetical protein
MPRAILAIRNYPAALMLAALLFAASLILAAGSLGYIGGDDEGSGIGGTGRNGEFGGSGAPGPFFGASDDTRDPDETDHRRDQSAPAVNDPEALDRAMRRIDDQTEPQMLRLREPVRTADLVNREPMLEALRQTREALRDNARQRSNLAVQNRTDVINIRIEVSDPLDRDALHESIEPYTLPGSEALEVADGSDDTSQTREQAGKEDPSDPRTIPDRVERPELPPLQRLRPVERASIAAPRPRPMRI